VPRSEPGARRRLIRRLVEPNASWSDARLVRQCLRGDDRAWSTLIAKYKNLIYSIPLRYGATPEHADDIFQSVCLELFARLPHLRKTAALRGWLITVTAHLSLHWKNRNRRRGEQELTELDEALATNPLPAEVFEELERDQLIREAVAELPPRCQEIIRLLFYEEPPIPYRDLAKRLGLAPGSIGFIRGRCLTRLHRALQRLGL
jgi:RNA polymerase sigma factor (sigma-70 family)